MDGRFVAPPVRRRAGRRVVSPEARIEDGATVDGPVLHRRRRRRSRPGRLHRPYSVIGRHCHIERGRRRRRRHPLAEHLGRPRRPADRRDRRRATATSAGTSPSATGRLRRQVGRDRLLTTVGPRPGPDSDPMSISPSIFKAYDVRGLYPSELDEAGARVIGRAFVAYLGAEAHCRLARHAHVVAGPGGRASSTAPARRAPTSSTTA